MKKSLIALAAVAASGAAMAQSSVTLYGLADIAVVKSKGESAQMISGGVAGSRWGLRGTEDLGGGLAVNFNFEQGVDLTNGSASGFDRQAWVGLSGGFGAIKLGKTGSAYDDIADDYNPVFSSVLSPAYLAPSTGYVWRPNSSVHYTTPSFGGVTAAVSSTFKDSGANNFRASAFNVKYDGGPLLVAVAYLQEKDDLGMDSKFTRVVGTYDFGAAKLLASVSQVKDVADDVTIGVDVPLGANLVLSTGVTHIRPEVGDNGNSFGLGVAYSLSKRSMLYTGVRLDDKKLTGTGERDHVFAVGVNHAF